MTRRRIGFAFQSDKPPGAYARMAAAAEHAGADVVSVYADLGFQPPLPALLEMARATTHVDLGPACLNPFTMHPLEIAGAIAALDAVSGGRAYLGLARGAWLDRIGIDQRGAVARVEECWETVRDLLAGRHPGLKLAYPLQRTTVPLLVGGWGRRMLAMAGRVGAREVKVGGSASPAVVSIARERVANAEVGIVMGAVTVVDEDGAAARAVARREVAMYLDVVADLDAGARIDPADLAAIRAALVQGDHERAGSLVPDEILDRFALSGTPDRVARQVIGLFEAGATRVEFGTPHGLTAERGIELIGAGVIPALAEHR